eukprot:1143798-Pelagomonas_calceolata.AAC.2
MVLALTRVPKARGHGITWAWPISVAHRWQTAVAASSVVWALQQWEHVFWTCPCTQATAGILVMNLHGRVAIHPVHVWLLVLPCPITNAQVWRAVCLCALNSMLKLRALCHLWGLITLKGAVC